MQARVRVRVQGRVQGVGFRYFALQHARRLGVRGYVRNCSDGSVEVLAEGDRTALEGAACAPPAGSTGGTGRQLPCRVGAIRREFAVVPDCVL
jgi:hypothetical protein